MGNDNEIRHGRHCIFKMHVHLVFVTKYRRGVFTKAILEDLRGIFASVSVDFEAKLVEFDGEDDHGHLLVEYPPKVTVSKLVNSLKGVSSLLIRKRTIPALGRNCGARPYGRPVFLPGVVAVRRLKLSGSTSSNNRHLPKN
jgi:putative transposase